MVGATAATALAQSALPRLAQRHQVDRPAYVRLVGKLAFCGAILGLMGALAAVLAGRSILALLYGAAYATQAQTLNWLMVGAGMYYVSVFLYSAIVVSRRMGSQLAISVTITAATTLACAALTPTRGALGAAMGVCIGALVQLVASAVVVVRSIKQGAFAPPGATPRLTPPAADQAVQTGTP